MLHLTVPRQRQSLPVGASPLNPSLPPSVPIAWELSPAFQAQSLHSQRLVSAPRRARAVSPIPDCCMTPVPLPESSLPEELEATPRQEQHPGSAGPAGGDAGPRSPGGPGAGAGPAGAAPGGPAGPRCPRHAPRRGRAPRSVPRHPHPTPIAFRGPKSNFSAFSTQGQGLLRGGRGIAPRMGLRRGGIRGRGGPGRGGLGRGAMGRGGIGGRGECPGENGNPAGIEEFSGSSSFL